MDKNKINKIKEFFKKEGFYVVLFLCLCVVAVVATIVTRNNISPTANNEESEFSLDISNNTENNVNNNSNPKVEEKKPEEKKDDNSKISNENKNDSVQTSVAKTETILHYPVEGNLSREYQQAVFSQDRDEARITSSIHVKTQEGAKVKAAGEGIVEEVAKDSGERGAYVKIKHTDGRITVYGNLNPEIMVNKGDKVNNTTVLGTVGSSSKLYSNTQYKNDLQFELYRADGTVLNPTIIFPYEKSDN